MIIYIVVALCIGYIIGSIVEGKKIKSEIQDLNKSRAIGAEKLAAAYDQIEQLKQDNKKLLTHLNLLKNDLTN